MTSSTSTENAQLDEDLEKQFLQYLKSHPDFFQRHGGILEELRIPHSTGVAISLIERQVDVLRNHNRQLRRQTQDLINIARHNDTLNKQIHAVTLKLMACDNIESLINVLYQGMFKDFKLDSVALKLFGKPLQEKALPAGFIGSVFTHREHPDIKIFDRFFELRKPICGKLQTDQLQYLFGERYETIKSSALLCIGENTPQGLLALGSQDQNRFQFNLGTLFLDQLAKNLSQLIKPLIRFA